MAAKKASPPRKKAPVGTMGSPSSSRASRAGGAVEPSYRQLEPYALHEIMGIAMIGLGTMLLLALVSYSPADLPSWVPFSSQSGQNSVAQNFIGPVGAVVAGYAYFFFGAAAYLVPAVILWWAAQILSGARPFRWRNGIALAVLLGSAACLVDFQTIFFADWSSRYNLPKSPGGFFGYGFGHKIVEQLLGSVGSVIVMALLYGIALIVVTGIHPIRFGKVLITQTTHFVRELSARIAAHQARPQLRPLDLAPAQRRAPVREAEVRKPARPAPELKPVPDPQGDLFTGVPSNLPEPKIIDSSQRSTRKLSPEEASASLFEREKKDSATLLTGGQFPDYRLPSLGLLSYGDEPETGPTDQNELLARQSTIVSTLASFGVDVEPGDITKGPTITRFELYPTPGLRVNKISALQADLARATCAERINILAPVPGKDTVGIEIANLEKIPVALRELFEDDAFRNTKAKLPLALGKDVYGRTIIGDLARMPHLLVAGATGSGKSVCINSIIASLLYRFTPDELRFIMIDPKVVEMQLYNDLPHMVVPVVTEPKKVLLALRWVINEMERRYTLFAKVGTRNFDGYNSMRIRLREEEQAAALLEEEMGGAVPALAKSQALELVHHVKLGDELLLAGEFPEEEDSEEPFIITHRNRPSANLLPGAEPLPDSLPYIVVIIDELADLMQTAPADVETGIARIAQKARAAGIHLIVATQTPRADVVTGIIKANIPSRIAFQVSSKTDSRIILDANGAENLVGKGDMLYLPPGSAQLIRAQGALITDEEAVALVEACAAQGENNFEMEAHEAIESGSFGDEDGEEISDADEEILEKCLEVVLAEKKASTSLLQRRLRLGYTRAARMIDILESRGIIGPGDGAKPREILVDLSEEFD